MKRKLKTPRRSILVYRIEYVRAETTRFPSVPVPARIEPIQHLSADELLANLAQSAIKANVRPHPRNNAALLWLPLLDSSYRLEFWFDTPLAAAVFLALYNAQVKSAKTDSGK